MIITHCTGPGLKYLFPFWIDMAVPIFMIISGYVNSLSLNKKMFHHLEEAYTKNDIIKKTLRFLIPYIFAFIIEIIGIFTFSKNINKYNILSFIRLFIIGGYGPGGYYTPIMFQFIFLFPVIYFIIKNKDFNGLLLCFVINAIFEILQRTYNLNEECYRFLVFRYIFAIATGCYIANGKRKINNFLSILCLTIGIIYIYIINYTNYSPVIIRYWSSTSFLTILWVAPIMGLCIKKFKNISYKPLELIGRASFNIFLVQMVYYLGIHNFLYKFIKNYFRLPVNIIFCIIIGVVFYEIEMPLEKIAFKYIDKLNAKKII